MPAILDEEQVTQVLRRALRRVANSPLLNDGVAHAELLALKLDSMFGSDDNLTKLVQAIKSEVSSLNLQTKCNPLKRLIRSTMCLAGKLCFFRRWPFPGLASGSPGIPPLRSATTGQGK